MKNSVFAILFVLCWCQCVQAQKKSIQFFKGTWREAIDKSIKEHKKIFVDCYTVWCVPCKNLADTVFTQTAVADYYNEHYINISIDMEKEDGKLLGTRYNVTQYPEMLYFNPGGFLVDKLHGLVPGAVLLAAAKTNINKGNSVTLDEQFAKGGYNDSVFLKKYMAYLVDTYFQGNYQFVFDDIIKYKGEDALYEKKYWDILGAANTGSKAAMFLVNNRDKFAKIYGLDAVDEKITSMYFNIGFLNSYQDALKFKRKDDQTDPFTAFKERMKSRNIPNLEFMYAMSDFYKNCRANNRTEAFAIAKKALVHAKGWQYHQFALLGDWLTAGRPVERAIVTGWAEKAVDKAADPQDKKAYRQVVKDLAQYAPDLTPKPIIYDFSI